MINEKRLNEKSKQLGTLRQLLVRLLFIGLVSIFVASTIKKKCVAQENFLFTILHGDS
jgi:hypothetical protein